MKNIVLKLVLSIFLFGCSKSDYTPNDINDNSDSILGSWDLISVTKEEISSYLDPIYGTEEIQNTSNNVWYDISSSLYLENWTFRLDDTLVRNYLLTDSLGNITWGDTLTYSFEKIDDTLLLFDYYTIITLNNHSLSLQKTNSNQWSNNDTTFLWKETEVFNFTKSNN